jgi:hypothetical protein
VSSAGAALRERSAPKPEVTSRVIAQTLRIT